MRTRSLAGAERAAKTCRGCSLWEGTALVYGAGPPIANLMFIGEAPGRHEDEQGKPFVGVAGQLLNTMLCEIGIRREDVYIANVIKHRPPKNRRPHAGEIQACAPWLAEQVGLIDPKLIVPLGVFATCTILDRKVLIRDVHGQQYERDGRTIIPTFHPAWVRRGNSQRMHDFREDFARIRKELDSGLRK